MPFIEMFRMGVPVCDQRKEFSRPSTSLYFGVDANTKNDKIKYEITIFYCLCGPLRFDIS